MKIKEVLSREFDECEIKGWIYRIRNSGGLAFAVIRDSTGIIQVTVKRARKKRMKVLLQQGLKVLLELKER
jgi:Aspartyl/asparaginyl-tRNA synthetases